MLGWMLKRGDAPGVPDSGDTTQLDQPDTPAPVFAARAFKSALFGQPAHNSDQPPAKQTKMPARRTTALPDQESATPSKPQGILLTPGTGTSRRKRVSFGHEVPKTKPASANGALAATDGEGHKKTRLNEALEKARKKEEMATGSAPRHGNDDPSDSDWEEADDEDFCSHDITLDLNEPHSQSGKYWKDEFQKYHKDAKDEMSKLLHYKQMAKSYAKEKDAEAAQLAGLLKNEQQKVIKMERKIAENATHIVSKSRATSDETSPESLAKLTKQTALAVQYRQRVQELEGQLEGFLHDKEDEGADIKDRRRRQAASPRTQNTLLETQRELRRARAQVKELGELRDQVSSLKAQLKVAEKRTGGNEADDEKSGGNTRTQDLRAQLRQSKDECRAKDKEIWQLKTEFEEFRRESQAHDQDTNAVLERAHSKIADLKKEIKTVKAGGPEPSRPKSRHPRSDADEPAKAEDPKAEDPKPEAPIANADSFSNRLNGQVRGRSSFEIADMEEDESREFEALAADPPSLREKYRGEQAADAAQNGGDRSRAAPSALSGRPNLEKPRWQPFVPRSPRNRAYLGERISSRIQNGSNTPLPTTTKDADANDLSALAKHISRPGRENPGEADGTKVDLLQDRFARLGGPEAGSNQSSTLLANTSKSKLPPERRAAALARIEQRMAEKKRAQRRGGYDKENVRP